MHLFSRFELISKDFSIGGYAATFVQESLREIVETVELEVH